MANLRILAWNLAEYGYATITANPAMETDPTPVGQLILPTERASYARTTSLASQDIKLVFPANQRANMIAIARHNLTTAGTLRTLGYSDAAWTTGIYDSTALPAFSTSGLSRIDVYRYLTEDFRRFKNTAQYFTTLTTLQSMIFRLLDAGNPDGFLDLIKVFVGEAFETTYNPSYQSTALSTLNDGQGSRADDGTHSVDKTWKARKLVVPLDNIPESDLPELLAIADYMGKDKEGFLSLYPGEGGAKEIYHAMSFRITDSPTFNPMQYGWYKNTMTFEET